MLRASQMASGKLSTGWRIGRHTCQIANRRCRHSAGLLRKKVAHALRAGPFGVVVVHAAHHLADLAYLALLVIGGTQRMVEHHHARSSALGLHQLFHLWIVDATDLVLIEEVRDRGIVTHEAEAFAVEHERIAVQPGIVDGYMARI